MIHDLICHVKRGLNIRTSPFGNKAGVLEYGQHFYALTFKHLDDGTWWGKDKLNRWVMVANGHNPYFTEEGKPLLPLG